MASIGLRPNGHRWVFFKHNRKRHTVRLGAVDKRDAEDFKRALERLIKTRELGLPLEPEQRLWLQNLDDRPLGTLQRAGLADGRIARTINDLVAAYTAELVRRESKPSTLANAKVVCNNLVAYFKSRPITAITRDDAHDYRVWMGAKGGKKEGPLASTTVSRRCRRTREIFALAADEGWIERNPFSRMRHWNEVNATRDRYIPAATIDKLINAATDHEFRLLLAFCRYCGVRCPSEVQPLLWSSVDWEHGILTVKAAKTERYPGQAYRQVPIFEAVAPLVRESWEQAHVGQTLIFPNYQTTGAAITGKLKRLCKTAGVESWPKLFVNIRASCERDLLEQHPIDKVAAWLGHSPTTALKHYNRVAKEQHTRATGKALRVPSGPAEAKREAKLRQPAQNGSARACEDENERPGS